MIEGVVRLSDPILLLICGILVAQFRFQSAEQPDVVATALLMGLLLAVSIFAMLQVYKVESFSNLGYQLPRLLGGWVLAIGATLITLYSMKAAADLSRMWVGCWLLVGAVSLTLSRLVVRRLIRGMWIKGHMCRKVVLVGDAGTMEGYLARLRSTTQPVNIAAALVLENEQPVLPVGIVRLKDLVELEDFVRAHDVDQVILAMPLIAQHLRPLLQHLRPLPVEAYLYQETFGAEFQVTGLVRFADTVLLQLMRRPLGGWSSVLKMLEDRLVAFALLICISPLMMMIALAVKLSSPGPVLYRQLRYGLNGEAILVLKFRSMRAEVCDPPDAVTIRQATRIDPRTTSVGRWLRRLSLDELPQLLNVIRGEMSLVGPRPHAIAHDRQYSRLINDYLVRQRVKPGITGLAQINGCRGETSSLDEMRRRIEFDLEYIQSWSLLLDLKILVRTVLVGFHAAKAY